VRLKLKLLFGESSLKQSQSFSNSLNFPMFSIMEIWRKSRKQSMVAWLFELIRLFILKRA